MTKKKIRNKSKGILFWITGLSGCGKTTIAKKIASKISRLYGPTLNLSGDDFRKTFKLYKYSHKERIKNLWKYHNFCKLITDKKINIIFSIMGLYNSARNWNRKNIDNYVEIYIEANMNKIINSKQKERHLKIKKNIVGLNINAELTKKPDIVIKNDFIKSLDELAKELLGKIKNLNL